MNELLKDLRWRLNDIRDMLMTKGIRSGTRIYGCDEWSTPTVNLQRAIEKIDDALSVAPPPAVAPSADESPGFNTPNALLNDLLEETFWMGKGSNNHDSAMAWAQALERFLESTQPSAAGAMGAEREHLRAEQSASVMPQIGPLLDAWEGIDNDTKGLIREQAPDLSRLLGLIGRAMDGGAALAAREEAPAAPAQQASILWQLVPIRPTPEMVKAGMKRMFDEKRYSAPWEDVIELMFTDMAKAAPKEPNATDWGIDPPALARAIEKEKGNG